MFLRASGDEGVLRMSAVTVTNADPEDPASIACLRAYYAELAARFSQGFDVSLSRDPDAGDMRPPRGAFLIAWLDGQPIGCVGLKGQGSTEGEVKRLWVTQAARGRGLARTLMAEVEDAARALGMTRLRLDTNSALPEAVALYRNSGWREIDRFNDDPYPDVFFEQDL